MGKNDSKGKKMHMQTEAVKNSAAQAKKSR
jgi:hypothetical protein